VVNRRYIRNESDKLTNPKELSGTGADGRAFVEEAGFEALPKSAAQECVVLCELEEGLERKDACDPGTVVGEPVLHQVGRGITFAKIERKAGEHLGQMPAKLILIAGDRKIEYPSLVRNKPFRVKRRDSLRDVGGPHTDYGIRMTERTNDFREPGTVRQNILDYRGGTAKGAA
jgi:hypothetical protein